MIIPERVRVLASQMKTLGPRDVGPSSAQLASSRAGLGPGLLLIPCFLLLLVLRTPFLKGLLPDSQNGEFLSYKMAKKRLFLIG